MEVLCYYQFYSACRDVLGMHFLPTEMIVNMLGILIEHELMHHFQVIQIVEFHWKIWMVMFLILHAIVIIMTTELKLAQTDSHIWQLRMNH